MGWRAGRGWRQGVQSRRVGRVGSQCGRQRSHESIEAVNGCPAASRAVFRGGCEVCEGEVGEEGSSRGGSWTGEGQLCVFCPVSVLASSVRTLVGVRGEGRQLNPFCSRPRAHGELMWLDPLTLALTCSRGGNGHRRTDHASSSYGVRTATGSRGAMVADLSPHTTSLSCQGQQATPLLR